MKKIENDCCDCDTEGYPCLGIYCGLKESIHYYCDCCKEEVNSKELYEYEGQELCEECLLLNVPKAY